MAFIYNEDGDRRFGLFYCKECNRKWQVDKRGLMYAYVLAQLPVTPANDAENA